MDAITDALLALADSPWVFALVFAVCVIDGFFPPIPSEPVVIALAALAVPGGELGILPLLASTAAGAIAGDNLAYWIGSRASAGSKSSARPARGRLARIVRDFRRRPRVLATFRRAQTGLANRGASLILTARYIPVGRTAVDITAGASGFGWRRFIALSALGGVSWALYSVFIGRAVAHVFGDQSVLVVLVAVVIAIVLGAIIDGITRGVNSRQWRRSLAPRERTSANGVHSVTQTGRVRPRGAHRNPARH